MSMKLLTSEEDYIALLELSKETPVYLLKHSLICSISMAALREYERFLQENTSVPGFLLKIQENRELSSYIAQAASVTHQSPQALLFKDGHVIWNDSHYGISANSLSEALP